MEWYNLPDLHEIQHEVIEMMQFLHARGYVPVLPKGIHLKIGSLFKRLFIHIHSIKNYFILLIIYLFFLFFVDKLKR